VTVTRITTENPISDQWKMLSQYAYPLNISRYFAQRSTTASTTKDTVEFIAGCVRQAEAYFTAASQAPLDIAPLLVYYGSSNLLLGIGALIIGVKPTVNDHGMKLFVPLKDDLRISEVEIQPVKPNDGALQYLCNVFSNNCAITNGGKWTLEEIFSSVPDLKRDFELCYPGSFQHTIPIEVVQNGEITLDRIAPAEMSKYGDPEAVLSKILGLAKSYLKPQFGDNERHTILNRKLNYADIAEYSIFGRKHLIVSHTKNGIDLSPDQLIILHMGLYALGYLSRYRPEVWNPFIRSDTTGERLFIEKYLSICTRYIPNLVLNKLNDSRFQFVYEI
jgi:hypothetical protein